MTEEKPDNSANKEKAKNQQSTKKSALRSFLLYLVFMILLTVGSGIAVYYYTPVVLLSLQPNKPLIVKPHRTLPAKDVVPALDSKTDSELSFEEIQIFVPEEPLIIEEEEEDFDSFNLPEEEVEDENEEEEEDVEEIVEIPRNPRQSVTSLSYSPKATMNYSLLKAIELRDALKNGGDCRVLLEELIAMPDKTPEMDQALMDLLKSCLDRPINGQMKQAFYATKKRAILRIFQAQYPSYLAYLKALPYFLVDIRKKNPTTDTPLDILDRIQNAVEEERPQLVLTLIPELPENVQATLHEVTQLAVAEADLNKTLNQLMTALFVEEENHD